MFVTRRYALKSDRTGEHESGGSAADRPPLRIVLLTDLHNTFHGKRQRKLIDGVIAENPDLILLAGDFADNDRQIDATLSLLDGVTEHAPVYYVTGNHEYYYGFVETIWAKLKTHGAVILSDGYVELDVNGGKVVLCAADDPGRIKYDPGYDQGAAMARAFGRLGGVIGYKILIAHRPERIAEYLEYPFDLILAGHAHGGQVRIPFLVNGLYSPNQGFLPKYAGGYYEKERMIVSRGLSVYPLFPRVFNPPELVSITIA